MSLTLLLCLSDPEVRRGFASCPEDGERNTRDHHLRRSDTALGIDVWIRRKSATCHYFMASDTYTFVFEVFYHKDSDTMLLSVSNRSRMTTNIVSALDSGQKRRDKTLTFLARRLYS